LKIIAWKTLLKVFLMSTYIMAQSRCRSKGFGCPKGWPPNLQGLIFQTDGGIGVLEMKPEVVRQCSD
jgi:hypothetical protein